MSQLAIASLFWHFGKRQQMKHNHTNAHINDGAFRDQNALRSIGDHRRQTMEAHEGPATVAEIDSIVSDCLRQGFRILPDANIAIQPSLLSLWDTLAAGPRGCCILTGPIFHELRQWLDKPYRNQTLAAHIRSGLASKTWASLLGIDGFDEVDQAWAYYYTRLLWLRRFLALPRADDLAYDGLKYEPANVLSRIERNFGLRAMQIAKKGRDESIDGYPAPANDETHVILGFMLALTTGTPITFLTADYDVYETVFKLQYLLDTHYRSWLVALSIKRGGYVHAGTLKEQDGYWPFAGDIDVYKKQSGDFHEILPDDYASVPIQVIYRPPNKDYVYQFIVYIVRDLNKMLWTKAQSGGRSTMQHGDRNVHIDLGMIGPRSEGLIGVGIDKLTQLDRYNMSMANADENIVINSQERNSLWPMTEDRA